MYRKYISLIAIFVALSALVISAMLILASRRVSPTPTPSPDTLQLGNQFLPQDVNQTAYPTEVGPDWETYTNTKFGYSLKYPPGWATIINVTPTTKQETLETATSLDIFDSAAQKSYPDGVMTIELVTQTPNLPAGWTKAEITLNNISVQKFSADEQNLHTESYLIPQKGSYIQIDIRYPPGDQIQQTFAVMLSTLQLTR